MTKEKYLNSFKRFFGCNKSYFPKYDCQTIADKLQKEIDFNMPFDTAARDIECDAVILLVSSANADAVDAGIKLGNLMMNDDAKNKSLILRAMEKAKSMLEILADTKPIE